MMAGHPQRDRQRAAAALGVADRSSATGARRWCSPSPTPAPTSAPGAPRPSSSPTAPGTSTASSASSPTATPTTCSRTSCTWCWPGPRAPGPGTKGLSLFVVPKFLFDPQTGEPGERNGVFVTGLEHKMGLKVSATCELTFGQHGTPAVGYLVGDTHNGIAQMFKIIEYARMMVGTKAISTLSTGYLNALEYAKTRVQGADMTQMTDKTAPRVTHHPPPRRASGADDAEGLRRGAARAVPLHRRAPGRRGRPTSSPAPTPAMADRVNDLLLPIVKGVGSERAYQMPDRVAADLRRLRASCRTTRSSSTSATRRSTRSTRAPPRSRRRTSSSARSPATRAGRWCTWSARSQAFLDDRSARDELADRARAAGHRGRRRAGDGRRR